MVFCSVRLVEGQSHCLQSFSTIKVYFWFQLSKLFSGIKDRQPKHYSPSHWVTYSSGICNCDNYIVTGLCFERLLKEMKGMPAICRGANMVFDYWGKTLFVWTKSLDFSSCNSIVLDADTALWLNGRWGHQFLLEWSVELLRPILQNEKFEINCRNF